MQILYSVLEYIRTTADYSNAVLIATLPHVNDFAAKLNLPVPQPTTVAHVRHFLTTPHRGRIGGTVTLTNGFIFGFGDGYVTGFRSPHSFWVLQDPNDIPKFHGPLNMTESEAVELARSYIRKLGYSLEDVGADIPPQVEQAKGLGTNIVPHFRIRWTTPRGDTPTRIEINASKKVAEEIRFSGIIALERPPPKIDVEPGELPEGHPWYALNRAAKMNPAYAKELVPYVFREIEKWGKKLKWDIPRRVREQHVNYFQVSDQGGWPSVTVTFTNGWEFKYRHAGLTYAGSPRRFFDSDRLPFRIKNYVGQWRISEEAAKIIARREIAKLGYPEKMVRMDIAPRVFRPVEIKGAPTIPRLHFEWNYPNLKNREQWIMVEVDCDRGAVESILFDDVSLWDKRPSIKVPIAAKPDEGTGRR